MSIVFTDSNALGTVDTWRSLWPARELARRGRDAYLVGRGGRRETTGWAHRDTIIVHATNQDVGLTATVRQLKGLARAVWIQFDDDYSQLGLIQDTTDREYLNMAAGMLLRGSSAPFTLTSFRPWFDNLMDDHRGACARADGVIAATEEVAEAYRPHATGPVVVVHNWIPEWVTRIPLRRLDPPVAGWFGGLGAHRRDIEWLGTEAKRITRFGVVGDPQGVAAITGADLAHAAGWQRWQRLYRAIGRFSVGVVPVVDDAFNRPKSWIKPLEFAAMGVPSIVSSIPAYDRLQAAGLPLAVADTPESMVDYANVRLELAGGEYDDPEYLRMIVRKRFTLEGPGGDEWEAWADGAGAT